MQHVGGVSKSICAVLKELPKDIAVSIGASHCNNVYLRDSGLVPDLKPALIDWVSERARSYFPGKRTLFHIASKVGIVRSAEHFNRKLSVDLLKERKFDVFHPTFYDDYFLKYIGNKPFVLTVHDMMPELFPQYFRKNDIQIVGKKKLVELSSAIIVPSYRTKADLVRFFDIPDDKITVIYHGGPSREVINEPDIITEPYFLFVGARTAYKNFLGLLNDYAIFCQKDKDVKLVCVGAPFTELEKSEIEARSLSDRVSRVAADDRELKNLYAHAVAFIFPSRYEGFGLPVLESMAYGCPLLLNNRSCFPEVAGDAAMYFNSDGETSELPELMFHVLSMSPEERNTWINKGYDRLERFSWKRAGEQYAALYQSLC